MISEQSIRQRDVSMMLSRKRWDELPQVTDNYVIHARGYSIGRNLWLDAYGFYDDHMNLWNEEVRLSEGYTRYKDELWVEYAESEVDKPWLYWCITGSSGLTIQRQDVDNLTGDQYQLIADVIFTLGIPNHEDVSFFNVVNNNKNRMKVKTFYDNLHS